jgi:hypothetical protein
MSSLLAESLIALSLSSLRRLSSFVEEKRVNEERRERLEIMKMNRAFIKSSPKLRKNIEF